MIITGDALAVLQRFDADSFDSCVTDPPYHLTSIVKRFGAPGAAPAKTKETGAFARASRGFMGQTWDGGDVAFRPETWEAVFRVLKPGAHLVAFGGTRTYHRMVCAIEDAGFEIRDQLAWVYGTGFPKSHDVGDGWGTALKPAWEPIVLARVPLIGTVAVNMQEHGTGAINIDGCKIGTEVRLAAYTSLKPAHGNRLGAAGTAELRRGTQGEPKRYEGRHPANLTHDGSPEVEAMFPRAGGGDKRGQGLGSRPGGFAQPGADSRTSAHNGMTYNDSGSAARFFYSAKAGKSDRAGNDHPTVKPRALMEWLCRLVTRPGGRILDPFAGSGSTGFGARALGAEFVGIELLPKHAAIARRRLSAGDLFAPLTDDERFG